MRKIYIEMRRTSTGLNCDYCRCKLVEGIHPPLYNSLTVDHIIPICKGGDIRDFSNFALACLNCNLDKGELLYG